MYKDIKYSSLVLFFTLIVPLLTIFVVPKLYTEIELAAYSRSLFLTQIVSALISLGLNTILRRDFYREKLRSEGEFVSLSFFLSLPIFLATLAFMLISGRVWLALAVIGFYYFGIISNYLRIRASFGRLSLFEIVFNNVIPVLAMCSAPFLNIDRFILFSLLIFILGIISLLNFTNNLEYNRGIIYSYLIKIGGKRILHNFYLLLIVVVNKRSEYFFVGAFLLLGDFAAYNYGYILINFGAIIFARMLLISEKYLLEIPLWITVLTTFGYLICFTVIMLFVVPELISLVNDEYLGFLKYMDVLLLFFGSNIFIEVFATRYMLYGKEKKVAQIQAVKSAFLLVLGSLLVENVLELNSFYYALVLVNVFLISELVRVNLKARI